MDEIHEFQNLGKKVNEKKASLDSTLEKVSEEVTKIEQALQKAKKESEQDSINLYKKTLKIDSTGL